MEVDDILCMIERTRLGRRKYWSDRSCAERNSSRDDASFIPQSPTNEVAEQFATTFHKERSDPATMQFREHVIERVRC